MGYAPIWPLCCRYELGLTYFGPWKRFQYKGTVRSPCAGIPWKGMQTCVYKYSTRLKGGHWNESTTTNGPDVCCFWNTDECSISADNMADAMMQRSRLRTTVPSMFDACEQPSPSSRDSDVIIETSDAFTAIYDTAGLLHYVCGVNVRLHSIRSVDSDGNSRITLAWCLLLSYQPTDTVSSKDRNLFTLQVSVPYIIDIYTSFNHLALPPYILSLYLVCTFTYVLCIINCIVI